MVNSSATAASRSASDAAGAAVLVCPQSFILGCHGVEIGDAAERRLGIKLYEPSCSGSPDRRRIAEIDPRVCRSLGKYHLRSAEDHRVVARIADRILRLEGYSPQISMNRRGAACDHLSFGNQQGNGTVGQTRLYEPGGDHALPIDSKRLSGHQGSSGDVTRIDRPRVSQVATVK